MASRRLFLLSGLALAGASALAGCGPRKVAQSDDRTLIYAQDVEPAGLNVGLNSAASLTFTASKIFDGLLSYDLEGKPVPSLASGWDISPDGLTYRFTLRPDVKWHDGTAFTAEDVAFSLQKVWREYHGRGRTTYANVIAVDSPDPHTSVWRLSKPAPYLISCLAGSESPLLPKHVYEGADILTHPANNAPIGTGPFRFDSWERGNQIVLERFADYYEAGKPGLDKLIIRFLPDATSAAIALETGSVDLISNVPASEIERLSRNPNLNLLVAQRSYSPTFYHLEYNLTRPALKDVRVRRAIAHAIDRAFIARHIQANAEVADSPVPAELTAFHADGLPSYDFNVEKAKALLDEAGVLPGPDGIRLRLSLDFSGTQSNIRTGAAIRATLAQVGIALTPRAQDQGEYINRIYTRRDFDLSMTGSGAGLDPAIGIQRYYWSKNIKPGVPYSNGPHYINPEVDQLLEAAQVEIDTDKRRALYNRFQHIAMSDLPYLPLYWTKTQIGARSRVKGLLTNLSGLNSNFADVTLSS